MPKERGEGTVEDCGKNIKEVVPGQAPGLVIYIKTKELGTKVIVGKILKKCSIIRNMNNS